MFCAASIYVCSPILEKHVEDFMAFSLCPTKSTHDANDAGNAKRIGTQQGETARRESQVLLKLGERRCERTPVLIWRCGVQPARNTSQLQGGQENKRTNYIPSLRRSNISGFERFRAPGFDPQVNISVVLDVFDSLGPHIRDSFTVT